MQASIQAKQLMYRLLHRDPKNRLGSQEGADEIKRHPFFKGINWALVRCMVTPKGLQIAMPEALNFRKFKEFILKSF